MKKHFRVSAIILLITLSVLSAACNLIPQVVRNLIASPTPTSTNTPTSTPTPTNTATPTHTPLPPVQLLPCVFSEDCPEAVRIDDIIGSPTNLGNVYNVEIPYDQPVLISIGWWALDQNTLEENLSHMTWIFTIDGQDYFQDDWPAFGETTFENDPSNYYPGDVDGRRHAGLEDR